MKVKADHWTNVNGKWFGPGEEYGTDDMPVSEETPAEPQAEKKPEQPKRTTRKRKSA